jgi:2-polyprenyl-3-methyl-5-hydroxy-6-metoxy-1,4-benzoquinol methylase
MAISHSERLEILESFAFEIPGLYPKPILDYRGREISADSVLHYLKSEKDRFAEIANLLPPPASSKGRLLDIGIAYGFLPVLLKKTTDWQCDGLDVPENISAYCKFAEKHGIHVYPGSLGVDPLSFPRESFDTIIFSEVFEHLRLSPSVKFRELHRILTPNGILVITTPNIARITNIIKLILGKNILEEFPENAKATNITEHLIHIREYTMGELQSLLRQSGFHPVVSKFSSCMERHRQHSLLTRFVPRWRGNLMIVAQKVS